ncbi:MAG TPA: hypothetical protein VND94_00975 [Terriglobia bacterium]|nr:hypothetical protein [Terriglobia bacterium]
MYSSLITVVTPATTKSLTTRDRVKSELGVTSNSDNAGIDALIADSSRIISSYCDRVFAQEVVSEVFRRGSWRPAESIILSRFPCTSIASLTEDGVAVAGSNWEADPETGIIRRLSGDSLSCWTASKIIVAYTAGYVLPGNPSRDLPEDIERACLMLTKLMYFSRSRDPLVKEETIDGVGSASYYVRGAMDMSIMPVEITSLIEPYRRIAV